MDIQEISTVELATELAKRKDLAETIVRTDGLVGPEHWPLRAALGAVPCVDAVAIRFRRKNIVAWKTYGGVIRRNTGIYAGKLCLIGGVVAKNESIEHALRRHWKADLGFEIGIPLGWDHPVCMRQYAPQVGRNNLEDFCHDPGKHSYASTHVVTVPHDQRAAYGTKVGGQEAAAFHWYSAESAPAESEWGYNMRDTFLHVLAQAEKLRPTIQPGY